MTNPNQEVQPLAPGRQSKSQTLEGQEDNRLHGEDQQMQQEAIDAPPKRTRQRLVLSLSVGLIATLGVVLVKSLRR